MPFLIAFVASAAAMPVFLVAGRAAGLVDRPSGDGLKIHARPVPLTGGVAVAIGVVAGLPTAGPVPWWLPAAIALALAVGIVDDARSLPPWVRVVVQASAGVLLVGGGLRPEPLGVLAGVGVILVALACTNAVNLMDGQDGLAGGLAAVAAAGFVMLAPGTEDRSLALAVCGALAAFLLWNRPPARVFLGNGGAYAVGVMLAVLASRTARSHWPSLLAAAVCLGPFAFELVSTVLRRSLRGRSLSMGDRGHAYDLAAELLGGRTRSTVLFLIVGAISIPVAVGVSRSALAVALVATAAYAGALALGGLALDRHRISMREASDEPAR